MTVLYRYGMKIEPVGATTSMVALALADAPGAPPAEALVGQANVERGNADAARIWRGRDATHRTAKPTTRKES